MLRCSRAAVCRSTAPPAVIVGGGTCVGFPLGLDLPTVGPGHGPAGVGDVLWQTTQVCVDSVLSRPLQPRA